MEIFAVFKFPAIFSVWCFIDSSRHGKQGTADKFRAFRGMAVRGRRSKRNI
jgi:hypothetical protein